MADAEGITPGHAEGTVAADAHELEEFERMVERHDLTFEYSDDGRVWRKGCDQLDAIRAKAKRLPLADVVRIWNAQVDRKVTEGLREPFYWKS